MNITKITARTVLRNWYFYLKGFKQMAIFWLIMIIAVYFLLQLVILPKLGIST
jgi:hypothetical protein